jgi:hypothetical protein
MQIERFFSSKLVAAVGSVVIATCLAFSPSPYDTARGFSAASVSTAVSNTASKGDRLTSKHPSSAREAAGPQQTSAKHSGKIPIGCETAFSKLAHRADLSARRCIT